MDNKYFEEINDLLGYLAYAFSMLVSTVIFFLDIKNRISHLIILFRRLNIVIIIDRILESEDMKDVLGVGGIHAGCYVFFYGTNVS